MAKIKEIPGLTATIVVDGQTAKEYDDPDRAAAGELDLDLQIVATGRIESDGVSLAIQPKPVLTKYIEAKSGATFSINVEISKHFVRKGHHVAFEVQIDDLSLSLKHEDFLRHECSGESNMNVSWIWKGNAKDGFFGHQFRFRELKVVDSEESSPEEIQKQVDFGRQAGRIQISLYFMQYSTLEESIHEDEVDVGFETVSEVCEKVMKGKKIDLKLEYDRFPCDRPMPRYKDIYEDPRQRPFAVFIFQYRSKQGLIEERIIPRPTALEEVQSMTEDEARRRLTELLEEQRRRPQTEPTLRGIKRELSQVSDGDTTSQRKERRLGNGSYEIDLTSPFRDAQ